MAAQTGAPAHAKTITALLTNQFFKGPDGKPAETPPDVLYWALKAAENLLAAPDPSALGTPNAARHTIKDEDLVPLVRAINDMVLNNPKGLAEKSATLKPELAVKPPPGRPRPPRPTPGTPGPRLRRSRPTRTPSLPSRPISSGTSAGRRSGHWVRCGSTPSPRARRTNCGRRSRWRRSRCRTSRSTRRPPRRRSARPMIGLSNVNPSSNLNVDALLHVIALRDRPVLHPEGREPGEGQVAAVEGVRGPGGRCVRAAPEERPVQPAAQPVPQADRGPWPGSSPAR